MHFVLAISLLLFVLLGCGGGGSTPSGGPTKPAPRPSEGGGSTPSGGPTKPAPRPSEMGDNLPYVDLGESSPGTPYRATAIAAGWSHTCALLHVHRIKCWGENRYGRLGLGDEDDRGDEAGEMGDNLPFVDLGESSPGTPYRATAIVAGFDFNCALFTNGKMKCWGSNNWSHLGIGFSDHRGDDGGEMGNSLPFLDFGVDAMGDPYLATAITASCALLTGGKVKCWGNNSFGQLGHFSLISSNVPTPPVDLGTGGIVTAISTSGGHTCALLDNAKVKCWGKNIYGQLGLGDDDNRGDDAGEMGDQLPFVNLGTGRTATAISTGPFHTCALLTGGKVKCWGDNSSGELGLGDKYNRGDRAGEMGDNLPIVDLGTGYTATAIAAGGFLHTCVLLTDGKMKCWGWNGRGQLGLDDYNFRGFDAGEMGDALLIVNLGTGRTATAIYTGSSHTCALLDNAKVKCWGDNSSGELGLGDKYNRGDGR